jgi:predicted dehydrogenase
MNLRAIYSAIAGAGAAQSLFATAADGHQEVAICEAITKSNQARKWITV